MYLFQIMDYYSASGMSMLFLVFFQTISINWIFGGNKFCDAVEQMLGQKPSRFLYICWVFLAPAVMLVIPPFSHLFINRLSSTFCWSTSGHLRVFHRSVHASDLRSGLPVSNVGGSIRYLHISVVDALDTALCSLLHLHHTGHFAGGNFQYLILIDLFHACF